MDNGPFRVPRPASRPVPGRQEQVTSPNENQEPSLAKQEVKAVHRPSGSNRFEDKRNKFKLPIAAAVAVVVLVIAGWSAWSYLQGSSLAIDSGKYQAVFFSNGHVYFGKLSSMNKDYMKLTEVFYLQSQSSESNDAEAANQQPSNSQSIIKLGDEIHGPEDAMIISKEHVLFYENLKPDGKVAKAIEEYKNR